VSAVSGLAALMFVELADFNEAFERDERAALVLLSRYRDFSDPVIALHGGDIADITGSELLVSFGSAVAATQCALHFALGARGLLASEGAADIKARIGLHMGEIWRQDGKVFGNGVNIAARVMQAAPPGALYLSEDCYRQVATKLDLRAREAAPLDLKNISRRLALYELDWGEGFAPAPGPSPAASTGREDAAERRAKLSSAIKEAVQEALARHVDIHIDTRLPDTKALHNAAPAMAPEAPGLPPSAPLPRKFGFSLSMEPPGLKAGSVALEPLEPKNPPEPAAERRTPAMELEARRDKAAAIVAASVKTLAFNGILGGILGYAYARSDSVWYLAGAALLGLLPFLSALRRLFRAGAELKRIEKQERIASPR
jgi:class 3 adenylate cyclase